MYPVERPLERGSIPGAVRSVPPRLESAGVAVVLEGSGTRISQDSVSLVVLCVELMPHTSDVEGDWCVRRHCGIVDTEPRRSVRKLTSGSCHELSESALCRSAALRAREGEEDVISGERPVWDAYPSCSFSKDRSNRCKLAEGVGILSVWIDDDDVRGVPPAPRESLKQRRHAARLAGTCGAHHRNVPGHELTGIHTHWDFLSRSEPPDSHGGLALGRKQSLKVAGRREVDGIVKSGITSDTTLEGAGTTVDLSKEFNLKPPLTYLDRFDRSRRPAQFSNSEEANLSDEIDQSLRYSDDRSDLADSLQLSTKYRSRSREVWIECNRDLSTKHVPDSADACWLALSHVTSSPRSATH